jgi:hypothetical protein
LTMASPEGGSGTDLAALTHSGGPGTERPASAVSEVTRPAAARPPAASAAPPTVVPLSPGRYKVTFTASTETCQKLRAAQDLLRHVIPDGDPGAIVARALDLLVEDLVRRKCAATSRPRPGRGQAPHSRNIPAEVKRAVFVRDGGGCAFVAKNGHPCRERGFVELHHVRPYAAGGPATAGNIQLRCRAHNAYEAEEFFGPMRAYDGVAAGAE